MILILHILIKVQNKISLYIREDKMKCNMNNENINGSK